MKIRGTAPIGLGDGIYWLGSSDNSDALKTNIYLIYREGAGVIIDPGPRAVFRNTLEALREIAPLEDISALIASGSQPDICSSLPSWEEQGFQGKIFAHRDTVRYLSSYGLLSPAIPMDEDVSGHGEEFLKLRFFPLDLRACPGGLLTFDTVSGTLFSSHLFGAYGERDGLYADEPYFRGISANLRECLTSKQELAGTASLLGKLPIGRICPQHGCVIDNAPGRYLDLLRSDFNYPEADGKGENDWKKKSFDLNEELVLSSDEKLLDKVTGLYNAGFFYNFLPEFINANPGGVIACLRIDGMKEFNNTFGFQEGDRVIATFASMLLGFKPEDSFLFRDSGPILFFLLPDRDNLESVIILKNIQNVVRNSRDFVRDMTCSIAAVRVEEVSPDDMDRAERLTRIVRHRLRMLDSLGASSLCLSSEEKNLSRGKQTLMVIDPDPLNALILRDYFSKREFAVHTCRNGTEALALIDLYHPDFIISETNIPQMNGFRIREKILFSQENRHIPFLFLSHLKTEEFVFRAHKLGVYHYLKKPVMLPELLGIVQSLTEGGS